MSSEYQAICEAAEVSAAARRAPTSPLIRVDLSTSSIAAGADLLWEALEVALAQGDHDAELVSVGTLGMSWLEPVVEVETPGAGAVVYGPVPACDAVDFLAAALGDNPAIDAERWVIGARLPAEGVPPLSEHPFWSLQQRRLMQSMGIIDPERIDEAIAEGAYGALDRAIEMEPMAICDLVLAAGVGGRGGGGFPAGQKWKFLLGAPGPTKYLVCNADEGDPGAFVNRVLMESDPHLVIEGMAIAGRATGSDYGFIYIRDEYPLSIARMELAIEQARERGLLGSNLLGSDFSFDLEVTRGAGSYVCGEETGLIASVEGLRGMPKIRPPFPAQRGVFDQPSNVNNTETYANVPLIVRHGAAWYREFGTESDPGTKMFSITGSLIRPGILEVPFGLSMDELLLGAGGGPPDGHTPKGIQPGGPLGGLLPASDLGLALERPPFTQRGVLLGSGGLILFDERASAVDLTLYFSEFCEDESCGRCTTCHGGSQRLVEVLERILHGDGRREDLDRIGALDRTLQNANCLHGQFTPYAVRGLVNYFRDELDTHIDDKRDPAKAAPGLIRYIITDPSEPALAEAAELCPTQAILEQRDEEGERSGWRIDDAKCIRCDVCREVAPNAVRVEDRFIAMLTSVGGD
jgi:NADH-quinone oxidoreductase subunit F